jgi:hypothetical protein
MTAETRVDIGKRTEGYITICIDGEYSEYWHTDTNLLNTVTRFCQNNGKPYYKAQLTSYYMTPEKARFIQKVLEAAILTGEAKRQF